MCREELDISDVLTKIVEEAEYPITLTQALSLLFEEED